MSPVDIGGKEYLTTQELASELNVDPSVVSRAARKEQIPGHSRVLGQHLFDPEIALEQWEPPGDPALVPVERQVDAQGRFLQGNRMSVGNRGGRAPQKKEEKYLKALYQCVTVEEWLEICERAKADAIDGDWRARQWLGNYLVGKPVQRVEVDADVRAQRILSESEQAIAIIRLLEFVEQRLGGKPIPEILTGLASECTAESEFGRIPVVDGASAEQHALVPASGASDGSLPDPS